MRRLAVLLVLLAAASRAEAVALTPPQPDLVYGDESVATADGARGTLFNPATVGLRYPSEFLFSWTREQPRGQINQVLGSAGGFGLRATRVKDLAQTYGFSLAGGDPGALRVGFAPSWLVSGLSHEVRADYKLGLLSRPTPWLSLGGTLDHLFQPLFQTYRRARAYTLGVGVRPFALDPATAHRLGTRLTLTGDLTLPEDGEWGQTRVRISGEFEALPGLMLRGAVEDHGGVHVGIGLIGLHAGLHVQTLDRDGPRAQTTTLNLHSREDRTLLVAPRQGRVATLTLGGVLGDESLNGISLFGPVSTTPVKPIHERLERALADPLTRGVLLDLRGVSNMAQLEEIRPRIARLRAAGKPVVAYLEEGATRGDLYLASACDRIVATEEASFGELGLRVERRYYRRLLADWGVRIERSAIGAYKSAYRNWSADSTPPADREAIEHALDQSQELFVGAVAAGRHMERDRLLQLLDGRDWPAHEVQRAGLVDSIGYREDALRLLGRLSGLGDRPRVANPARDLAATRDWNVPARVAVVYASGGIQTGASGNDLLFGPSMGAATVSAQIERAFRQRGVRAVVLRVESTGGSSLASNLIHHALARMKQKTRKPLVVSMGSVAASGGYYIAMNADRIFADRFTRTGSIGVVRIKPSIAGWDRKHGVREDDFERGRFMGRESPHQDWDARDQAAADSSIQDTYRRFVARVAQGRGLTVEAADAVAQGRVWLGDDARERRLVDEIGGLEQAIAEARRRGGVPAAEEIRIAEFRRPRPSLIQRLAGSALAQAWERTMALPEPGETLDWADDDSLAP